MATANTSVSPPAIDLDRCAVFFHHRWSVPVLAYLGMAGAARPGVISAEIGVSRDTLRHTLAALIEWQLVRADDATRSATAYELRPAGAAVAPACEALTRAVREHGLMGIALHKWSMPVLAAMGLGARRFSDLEEALQTVTPRALSRAMRELVEAGLVTRTAERGRYALTGSGSTLGTLAGAMLLAHEKARREHGLV